MARCICGTPSTRIQLTFCPQSHGEGKSIFSQKITIQNVDTVIDGKLGCFFRVLKACTVPSFGTCPKNRNQITESQFLRVLKPGTVHLFGTCSKNQNQITISRSSRVLLRASFTVVTLSLD